MKTKTLFQCLFGAGFPLILSLNRWVLHLLSGPLRTPEHPRVLHLTPDGGKVSGRRRK